MTYKQHGNCLFNFSNSLKHSCLSSLFRKLCIVWLLRHTKKLNIVITGKYWCHKQVLWPSLHKITCRWNVFAISTVLSRPCLFCKQLGGWDPSVSDACLTNRLCPLAGSKATTSSDQVHFLNEPKLYCPIGSGFILSRHALQSLCPHVKVCASEYVTDDVAAGLNMARCMKRFLNMTCEYSVKVSVALWLFCLHLYQCVSNMVGCAGDM